MDPFELAADLDAFAAETPELPDDDTAPEEVVLPGSLDDCRDLANKLLRKHHRLQRDADNIRAVARAEHERIAQWTDDRMHGVERETERVESLLDRLMRAYNTATHGKTLKLPNGELRLRAARERLVVDDEREFVEWAKANAEPYIEAVYRVHKRAINEAAKAPDAKLARELSAEPLPGLKRWRLYDTSTGETLPGVVVETDEQPTFSLSSARTGGVDGE